MDILDVDLIQRVFIAIIVMAALVVAFVAICAAVLQEQSKPLIINRPERQRREFSQPAAKGGEWRTHRRERRTS